MKKNILFFIIAFNYLGLHAQIQKPFRAQVYIGGPSLLKLAFKFSKQFQDVISYTGQPGLGGEFDFRFNRWFSAGIDFNYRYGQLDMDINEPEMYDEIDEKWGIDLGPYDPFGHYTMKIPRYRFTLVGNVHLLEENLPSDLYVSMGLGYNKVNARLYLDGQEIEYSKKLGSLSIPLAYRLSVGYAYHFHGIIGVFGELGLGGPLLSVGLSARF